MSTTAAGPTKTRAPDASTGHVLREPWFAPYLAVFFLSCAGIWMERVALGWIAWQISHSPFWTGLVTTLVLAPSGVLLPVIAVFAERWNMKRAAMLVYGAMALVSLSIFAVVAAGIHSIGTLVGLSALLGVATALHHPVRLVMISLIVTRENISSAVGLSAAAYNLARIVGPAAAGLTIAGIGPSWAFLFNALTFVPLIWIISRQAFRPVGLRDVPGGPGGFLAAFFDGARHALRDSTTLWALMFATLNGLTLRAVVENMPAVTGALYGGSERYLALLTSAGGAGAVLGAMTLGFSRRARSALPPAVVGTVSLASLALCLFGLAPRPTEAAGLVAVIGFAITFAGSGTQTLVQLTVSDAYRARVLSWWSTCGFLALGVGGIGLGALAEVLPMGQVIFGHGVLSLLAVVVIVVLLRPSRITV